MQSKSQDLAWSALTRTSKAAGSAMTSVMALTFQEDFVIWRGQKHVDLAKIDD